MLGDNLGKNLDYLRISVTDRCNLRCNYCMPQGGIVNKPHSEILTFEEIFRATKIFISLGVKKIRLTGGEPLARKDIAVLIKSLGSIKGLEEIALTTNGSLLSLYAEELKEAGLKRINISLDTLREDRFKSITKRDCFYDVIRGIEKAKKIFDPLKLNVVVMKDINDDEIIEFVDFARSRDIILRFIEFMRITPLWKEEHFVPIEEVMSLCEEKYKLERAGGMDSGPAAYYIIKNGGILGFIKTDEENCKRCTRLRLTSTGDLKICLYETQALHLKGLLRMGVCDEEIRDIIKARMETKEYIDYRSWEPNKVYMCDIGG